MHISQTPAVLHRQSGAPFASLPLSPAWLDALSRAGHETMTAFQAATLPLALSGKDLVVQRGRDDDVAMTLALALLHRLDVRRFDVQALVLCPTRDRAESVAHCLRDITRAARHIKVALLCHGGSMRLQIDSLIHGAHIAVGTPGRLLDHVDAASLDLRAINTVVFDGADTMLDMGFVDDIAFVASRCPRPRQTLLFHRCADADLPPDIARMGRLWMRKPQIIVDADTQP